MWLEDDLDSSKNRKCLLSRIVVILLDPALAETYVGMFLPKLIQKEAKARSNVSDERCVPLLVIEEGSKYSSKN